MLRPLLAVKMVQVVTWKTQLKLKAMDPKCYMELTKSYGPSFFKEYLGLILRIPTTNFLDFVWVFFPGHEGLIQ